MNLQQFAKVWHAHCSYYYKGHKKEHLTFLVVLPNGKKQWYRASPKLEYAVRLHIKTHGSLSHDYFAHTYINVPIVPYFGHNRAIIGVGKIIFWRFKKVYSSQICTRSQFVKGSDILHLRHCYHYLRHDYDWYSRLNIIVDLYMWKMQARDHH